MLSMKKSLLLCIYTYVLIMYSQLGYEIISDEKLRDIFSRFRDLTKQKKVSIFYVISSNVHIYIWYFDRDTTRPSFF